MRPGALEAVLVTHEHSDHTSGLEVLCRRHAALVVCNPATLGALRTQTDCPRYLSLRTGEAVSVGPFEVASFPVSHDAAEPVGYTVEAGGSRVTALTDLGDVRPELVEPVGLADLVVLEANHDLERLWAGPYPQRLKRRITSDSGHLSNAQAAELILRAHSNRPQTFWLAHLSKTNNTRRLAGESVAGRLAREGLRKTVLVTERDRPSLVWEPGWDDGQLSLFGAPRP
jgi:phosphoribosyl 1,2-cyclic phosphodiesterase